MINFKDDKETRTIKTRSGRAIEVTTTKRVTLADIQKQSVVLGPSFDWMFEGEDNNYDELYGDYI